MLGHVDLLFSYGYTPSLYLPRLISEYNSLAKKMTKHTINEDKDRFDW